MHIEVIDSPGGRLEGGEVKLFRNQRTRQDFARRFRKDRWLAQSAENIPYGKYELLVSQPGFPDAERPVDVTEADVHVQVYVRTATIHIVDVGPLAVPSEDIEVERFKSREDGYDLADRFTHDSAAKVPYGIYDIRVKMRSAAAEEVNRRVDVFQPDVWVLTELYVSPISLPEYPAPRYVLTGAIRNLNADDEPIYVTLVGLHIDFRIDDKVTVSENSGTFSLAGFNPRGMFLLITSGRRGVLDIREVTIPSKEPIVIDLNPSRPK